MPGHDCRNKRVFSFRQNTVNDEADIMSSGKLFHGFGPADSAANDRSSTVPRRDRRTASWLEGSSVLVARTDMTEVENVQAHLSGCFTVHTASSYVLAIREIGANTSEHCRVYTCSIGFH